MPAAWHVLDLAGLWNFCTHDHSYTQWLPLCAMFTFLLGPFEGSLTFLGDVCR